ncbi:hypothetical protein TNCV_212141 [Trichonephila clavipes]|nr:hypothetical protein TNCV_212141 [Trichonephila clavipes]
MAEKMPHCWIRAHYEQLPEFERGRIIRLKEAGKGLYLSGNVDNLALQLEQTWQEIPQETIRVLYHFMPRRVATFIQARGGSPPY